MPCYRNPDKISKHIPNGSWRDIGGAYALLDKTRNPQTPRKTSMTKRTDADMADEILSLPEVSLPSHSVSRETSLVQEMGSHFSMRTLAAAISDGCHVHDVQNYMQHYPVSHVKKSLQSISQSYNGHVYHPGFYAVKRNCVKLMDLLLEYSMSAKTTRSDSVPLLAYAIMWQKLGVSDTTELVKLLLSQGADPNAVPKDMWSNYVETPSAFVVPIDSSTESVSKASEWCNEGYRKVLAATLNLSQRYFLHRASQLKPPTRCELQIAKAHNITRFLKVPYQMIGQSPACKSATDIVFAHISMNVAKPLVLSFVGLSGHGKTELAGQMGELLSVEKLVVDMTQMRQDTDLFGPMHPYLGAAEGSPLNNFLAQHSGERTVVFLDEFDKTTQEVREAMLLILDSGHYRDHRDSMLIDASKVIWIFATNLGATEVREFFISDLEGKSSEERAKVSLAPLTQRLSELFMTMYTPAVAGRINAIIPFFPFNLGEQAVVAHKFLLNLASTVRLPIDLSEHTKRYVGHVHLALLRDGAVCSYIARGYIRELGARSLSNAVDDIGRKFFSKYADTDDEVAEAANGGPLRKFTVQLNPVKDDVDEISVVANGFTHQYGSKKSKEIHANNFTQQFGSKKAEETHADNVTPKFGGKKEEDDDWAATRQSMGPKLF